MCQLGLVPDLCRSANVRLFSFRELTLELIVKNRARAIRSDKRRLHAVAIARLARDRATQNDDDGCVRMPDARVRSTRAKRDTCATGARSFHDSTERWDSTGRASVIPSRARARSPVLISGSPSARHAVR
jgi:hypothetical protein